MVRVSFPGERGAYSEAAARTFFDDTVKTIPAQTFSEVLDNTSSGKTDHAVIPVENSLEGSVGESYDQLYSTDLNAIGEIYHRIEHCMIGVGKLNDVDTIYSHPQALGQCRNFIEKNGMKTVPTYDTAGSVRIVRELNQKNVACIASKMASEIYDVPIIAENIANKSNNYTRFLVLSKSTSPKSGNDKTSIIFSIKHEPGSLFKIIENFHRNGTNLTKIESRPTRTSIWEYNFYVDFEGHADSPEISQMLRDIKECTIFLKILGSYPSTRLESPRSS